MKNDIVKKEGMTLGVRKRPWLKFLSLLLVFTFIAQTTNISYLLAEESELAPLEVSDDAPILSDDPAGTDFGLGDEFYTDYGSYDDDGSFIDPYANDALEYSDYNDALGFVDNNYGDNYNQNIPGHHWHKDQ